MGISWNLLILLCIAELLGISSGAPLVESRDNLCSGGVYAELSPILKQYPQAAQYCSANYPVSCTSEITKRAAPSTTTSVSITIKTSTTHSTAQTSTTTKSNHPVTSVTTSVKFSDVLASAISKIEELPVNVISTLCSCVEATPKACPIKSSATTTTTTKATFKSSTTAATATTTTTTTTLPTTTSTMTTTMTTTTTTTTTSSQTPTCTPQTITGKNGGSYDVDCNYDSQTAGQYQVLFTQDGVASINDCINLCEGTNQCLVVNYYTSRAPSQRCIGLNGSEGEGYMDGEITATNESFYDDD